MLSPNSARKRFERQPFKVTFDGYQHPQPAPSRARGILSLGNSSVSIGFLLIVKGLSPLLAFTSYELLVSQAHRPAAHICVVHL